MCRLNGNLANYLFLFVPFPCFRHQLQKRHSWVIVLRLGKRQFVKSIRFEGSGSSGIARNAALRSKATAPVGGRTDHVVSRQRITVDKQKHIATLAWDHLEFLIVAHILIRIVGLSVFPGHVRFMV